MPDELSNVDPRFLAETRRRIDAVRAHARVHRPTCAQTAAAATSLGMTAGNFRRLVRAWRETGTLPNTDLSSMRRQVALTSRRGIPARTREIVETIAAQARGARLRDVVDAVRSACAAHGLEAPSPASVWLIMKHASPAADFAAPGLLVTTLGLDLNVAWPSRQATTMIAIAIAVPERVVIATTGCEPHPASGASIRIVDDLARTLPMGKDGRPLLMHPRDLALAAAGTLGILAETQTQRTAVVLRAALGAKLDTIGYTLRARAEPPVRVTRTRPMSPEEADAAVVHAVLRHNIRLDGVDAGAFTLANAAPPSRPA